MKTLKALTTLTTYHKTHEKRINRLLFVVGSLKNDKNMKLPQHTTKTQKTLNCLIFRSLSLWYVPCRFQV